MFTEYGPSGDRRIVSVPCGPVSRLTLGSWHYRTVPQSMDCPTPMCPLRPPPEGSSAPRVGVQTLNVPAEEIDDYLASVEQPKRRSLDALRRSILEVIPDAEQGISYGMPAFKVHGKTIAGFAAFKNHLSYLPHSGSVLSELGDDLAGYGGTKGSLHFAVDQPLPDVLVRKLVETRMRQLGLA